MDARDASVARGPVFSDLRVGEEKAMAFARFMSEPVGRVLRIALGIALIAVGIGAVGGVTGVVIAVVGAGPILAGAFNFCLVGPLVGGYFSGERNLREAPRPDAGRRGRPQH